MSTTASSEPSCQWCSGSHHAGTPCPWVKAIEYRQDGSVKRVEFREAGPTVRPIQRTNHGGTGGRLDILWESPAGKKVRFIPTDPRSAYFNDGPTEERGESACRGDWV